MLPFRQFHGSDYALQAVNGVPSPLAQRDEPTSLILGEAKMELRIRIPDKSSRQESIMIDSLRQTLVGKVDEAKIVKDDPKTQDSGTILTIVLGAPAIVGAVSAISAWLIRSNQSNVKLRMSTRESCLKT
jgi:hypothetical protein